MIILLQWIYITYFTIAEIFLNLPCIPYQTPRHLDLGIQAYVLDLWEQMFCH